MKFDYGGHFDPVYPSPNNKCIKGCKDPGLSSPAKSAYTSTEDKITKKGKGTKNERKQTVE